jgi:hypothetical protein
MQRAAQRPIAPTFGPGIDRRLFIAGCVSTAALGSSACAGDDAPAYERAASAVRAPLPPGPDQRELIRYATLAANSHNTQPWRFRIGENRIDVLPDFDRRTPAVDPDDHHLFVSLGCAIENLVVAAGARGLKATPRAPAQDDGAIAIELEPTAAVETPVFAAIPVRQSTRSDYDGKPVPAPDLAALQAAGTSDAVDVMILTEPARIEAVLALVQDGNSAQLQDPVFTAELKRWIRFNAADAVATGDGIYSGVTGNPSVPGWFGRLIYGFVSSDKGDRDTIARQFRSSAGLAIFAGKQSDRANWVEAGRSCQRFALQATALGIKHAFANQAVEAVAIRPKLAAELGLGDRRPDLIVRFGYGPDMPKSLRRPVASVIA